jgi:recombination protein RecT
MDERKFKEEMLHKVNGRIDELRELGMLDVPTDYSIGNALQYAWFNLQELKGGHNADFKYALDICTPQSIIFSLVKMVTDGVSIAKHQCYFMVRKSGNEFNLDYGLEYQGKIALAKRYSGIVDVDHQTRYEGEEYEAINTDGVKKIIHKSDMTLFDYDKILGAYCVVTEANGKKKAFELSMNQILTSWLYQFVDKNNPIEKLILDKTRLKSVHGAFKAQMCEKAVINYAMKGYINRSNDAAILPNGTNEKKSIEGEKKQTLSIGAEPKYPTKQLELKPNEGFNTTEKQEVKEDKKESIPPPPY